MKRITLVITNIHHARFSHDLRNHPLVSLAAGLRTHHQVSVLLCDPGQNPHPAELNFLKGLNLNIRTLKISTPCSPNWLTANYEVFETLREMDSDLIITEEYYGLLALYTDFSLKHCPVVTYALGGSYLDKLRNSAAFENIPDLLHATLEDIQLRKSTTVVASGTELESLYKSLGISHESFSKNVVEFTLPMLDNYELNLSKSALKFWLVLIEDLAKSSNTSLIKMERSKISLIIATKDRENFLPFALESCSEQTIKPSEVIIVDDGSENVGALNDIVELYSTKLNIRVIRNEISLGQAKSRNLGAQQARFPLLAFMDDDNYLLENHLESCLEVLCDSDVFAVSTFMNFVPSDNAINKFSKTKDVGIFGGDHFGSLNKVFNLVCDTHIVIRKDSYLEIGGFPDLYRSSQEDWGLGLKIMASGRKFKSTGVPTIMYRVNTDGVWATGSGVRKWWPIHHSGFGVAAPEWWYDEICRMTIHTDQKITLEKKSKFYLGLVLMKRRKFKRLFLELWRLILKAR